MRLFLLSVIVVVPVLAFAEKPDKTAKPAPAAADPTTVAAREKFQRGSNFYDLGKYKEAAAAYEEAYTLKNEPALLFNIGQAYRLGGEYAQALRAYRAFLRRVPDAQARPTVEKYIVNLEKLLEEQKRVSNVPPVGTVGPEQTSAPTDTGTTGQVTATPTSRDTPLYKKWWLWTIVGGVVVVGVAVGVGVALGVPNNADRPSGAFGVKF